MPFFHFFASFLLYNVKAMWTHSKKEGGKKKTTACQPKINELCFFFFRFLPLLLFAFSSVGFLLLSFFFFVLFCPFFPFFGLHQPRNGQSPAFFFVELLVAASFECHSALLSLCFFFFFLITENERVWLLLCSPFSLPVFFFFDARTSQTRVKTHKQQKWNGGKRLHKGGEREKKKSVFLFFCVVFEVCAQAWMWRSVTVATYKAHTHTHTQWIIHGLTQAYTHSVIGKGGSRSCAK